jgi:hypothetical protein
MAKFDDKVNGNTVDASEYNNVVRAFKNSIEDSGQTIDASNTQMSLALANYSAVSTYYTDSGAADAYVLNPIGSLKSPDSYYDGMLVRFRAGNANTGASTINVNSLGVKAIKKENGTTDIDANQINIANDTFLRFDSANDVFTIIDIVTSSATTTSEGKSILPVKITIANNTGDSDHDIDFSAGVFQFDDGSGQAVASALTKQIDAAWSAGNNQGGLDTGTVASNTWYYCFAIYDSTNGISDFIFSLSSTSPTLPGTYDKQQYLGAIRTDGSANIEQFRQSGSEFYYIDKTVNTYTASNPGTSQVTQTMEIPPISGIVGVINCLWAQLNNASDKYILFRSSLEANVAPGASNYDIHLVAGSGSGHVIKEIPTDDAQVWVRGSASDVNTRVGLNTLGWIDTNL